MATHPVIHTPLGNSNPRLEVDNPRSTSMTNLSESAFNKLIEAELALYGGLEDRPRIVALNKVDLPDGRAMADMVEATLRERGTEIPRNLSPAPYPPGWV